MRESDFRINERRSHNCVRSAYEHSPQSLIVMTRVCRFRDYWRPRVVAPGIVRLAVDRAGANDACPIALRVRTSKTVPLPVSRSPPRQRRIKKQNSWRAICRDMAGCEEQETGPAHHKTSRRMPLCPSGSPGQSARFLKSAEANAINRIPIKKIGIICGQSTAQPVPLRNTPRTMVMKYRTGFA